MNRIVLVTETVCTLYLMRYFPVPLLFSVQFCIVTYAMVSIIHYRIMLDSFLLLNKRIYITKNVELFFYC